MKRSKPMKRSALARSTPMRARSQKREQLYAGDDVTEGRRAFVVRILTSRPTCEAGRRIGAWCMSPDAMADIMARGERLTDPVWARCARIPVDVHEVLARSAGGSIFDDANVLALCRECHDWIGTHPREALQLGLRRSRYPGRNP